MSFRASLSWFMDEASLGSFSEQDLTEIKLAVFRDLDRPIDLCAEGLLYFNLGLTPELLERRRKQLLTCSWNDLLALCLTYFSPFSSTVFRSVIVGKDSQTIIPLLDGSEWNFVSTFEGVPSK
jgi:Zn-dependent M16 (insulinase) family peptidase